MPVIVDSAGGLVLASPIDAPNPLPRFHNSAVDGYAVCSADIAAADRTRPVSLPVRHHIAAGSPTPMTFTPGTTDKIMTGAPIPAGANSVVPLEIVERRGATVLFERPARAGANVRVTGEDIALGSRVLDRGTVLGPLHIGLLAALGVDKVSVRRRIRVAIVSTGSEITRGPKSLRFGEIYESNSVMLATAVSACGADVVACESVSDSVPLFRAVLDRVCTVADVVITTGGVSAGDHEVVKAALRGQDQMRFGGVAMSPGKPQGAGRIDGAALLAFPGNPLAAYVSFELFARPLLRAAMGLADDERPTVTARLAHPVTTTVGRTNIYLARRDTAGTITLASGTNRHGLGGVLGADCFVEIDQDTTDLVRGHPVTARLL